MADKTYRDCMAEIAGVLQRYDMAGAVTVVSKERCMFKYVFPTWGCISIEGDAVRIRSKRDEYPSLEAQKEAAELTAHIIMQIRDQGARTAVRFDDLRRMLESAGWDIEHTPSADFDPEREQ